MLITHYHNYHKCSGNLDIIRKRTFSWNTIYFQESPLPSHFYYFHYHVSKQLILKPSIKKYEKPQPGTQALKPQHLLPEAAHLRDRQRLPLCQTYAMPLLCLCSCCSLCLEVPPEQWTPRVPSKSPNCSECWLLGALSSCWDIMSPSTGNGWPTWGNTERALRDTAISCNMWDLVWAPNQANCIFKAMTFKSNCISEYQLGIGWH